MRSCGSRVTCWGGGVRGSSYTTGREGKEEFSRSSKGDRRSMIKVGIDIIDKLGFKQTRVKSGCYTNSVVIKSFIE